MNLNICFVDTSYLIALEISNDDHHTRAKNHWRNFIRTRPSLVTTSFVFDEVVTFFNSRNRHDKAVEVGTHLLNSPSVQLIQVDDGLFRAGWAYFERHSDKRYSLTDCISFVAMQQLKIQTALTFDRHFTQANFFTLPQISW